MKVIIMVKKNYIFISVRVALIFALSLLMSCEELFKFAEEQNANKREASEIEGISSTDEGNGKTSGVVSSSGNQWQQLQASSDTSIDGANVSFPPGAFAIDTQVSIEPGADLVTGDDKLPAELGLDDVAVENSAPSVIVQGDEPPLTPFSISIPIPDEGVGLNLVSDFSRLIVLYRIVDVEGKIKTGILSRDKLNVKNKLVDFKFGFYGVFQAIFTSIVIEKPVTETESTENIKNATGEAVAVDETILEDNTVVEDPVAEEPTQTDSTTTDNTTEDTNNTTEDNPPPPPPPSDTTPPGTPTVSVAAALTSDTTPTWTWTSGGEGNGTFRYKLDNNDLSSGATESVATTFTPSTPLTDGSHTLYVSERDDAGNWSAAGSAAVTIDTTAPTVTLSKTSATQISVVFSEGVTGLAVADFVVSSATADSLSGSGASYTLNITPSNGTVTIDLAAASANDLASNPNNAASQFSFTYDSIAPSVTLSSSEISPNNKAFVTISATFTEAVTGFALEDVVVTNGSASTFTGSGASYTFKVVPTTDGTVTIDIPAAVCVDASGNDNTSVSLSYVYDFTAPSAPTVSSAAAFTTDTTPNWTWISGGGGNGIYRYKLNDTDLSTGATQTVATSVSEGPLAEGVYTLYVQEQDDAGNWSTSGSFTLEVDVTAPIMPTSFDDGTITNSQTVSPIMSWVASASADVTNYYIWLGTSSGIDDVLLSTDVGNTTSHQFTSLSPLSWSTPYYASIKACDAAGNCSGYALGDGFTVTDGTAPTAPTMFDDGVKTLDLNMAPRFVFTNSSTDGETGMSHYEYAIGSTSGGSDIQAWTNIGLNTNFRPTGLTLTNNTMYYTSIRAVDNAGNVSSQVDGDGWMASLGTKISANSNSSCVRRNNGKVKCWGYDYFDMFALGDGVSNGYIGVAVGDMGDNLSHSDLDSGADEAIMANTGWGHACFLLKNNSVKCWGYGIDGILGSEDTLDKRGQYAATQTGDYRAIVNLGSLVPVDIVQSYTSTCILDKYGKPYCWGRNANGELGISSTAIIGDGVGEMGASLAPVALPAGDSLKQIAAGMFHFCGITQTNKVLCWGKNTDGQLGTGDTVNRGDGGTGISNHYVFLESPAKKVAAGSTHSCAILMSGDVKCWGSNIDGELGIGNTTGVNGSSSIATVNLGTGSVAKEISLGEGYSCALLDTNSVKCWGKNNFGQLGQGDINKRGDQGGEMGDALTAIDLGTGRTAKHIDAGKTHVCALLDNNSLKCWGEGGTYGKLGIGSTTSSGDAPGEMGDSLPAVDLGTL